MRIVSLVPSLTLTLFDLGLDATQIVGRTPWCIHPEQQVADVPVVGGTKTPTLSKIMAAQPDLVVMDRDENPKAVHDWCIEQGFDVFVCHVKHPDEVPSMLRQLGQAVSRIEQAEYLAAEIEDMLRKAPDSNGKVALPLIWHDPLMAANGATYAGNMISWLGYAVPMIEPSGTGYPEVTPNSLIEHGVQHVFLTTEPHDFSVEEGLALQQAVVEAGGIGLSLHHIDGEALTWMGSYTAKALHHLLEHHRP